MSADKKKREQNIVDRGLEGYKLYQEVKGQVLRR